MDSRHRTVFKEYRENRINAHEIRVTEYVMFTMGIAGKERPLWVSLERLQRPGLK